MASVCLQIKNKAIYEADFAIVVLIENIADHILFFLLGPDERPLARRDLKIQKKYKLVGQMVVKDGHEGTTVTDGYTLSLNYSSALCCYFSIFILTR